MSFIYHIFPLGAVGAAHFSADAEATDTAGSILTIIDWIPYLRELGVTDVLLGPVIHSESHGYDTVDLYNIDPRLGSNEEFARVCATFREAGIGILLDGVFNHVGRQFFAFQDLLVHGKDSRYRHWFHGLDFQHPSPHGDPFTYSTWDGHHSLVKLNLEETEVREYVLGAVRVWIEQWGVTGLRLDAADVIDPSFWKHLRNTVGPEMLLIGEMVHGDYRSITGTGMLGSVTNYEIYKGLYSSFNDRNMHEIAWSLNRQSGPEGIYTDNSLYTFVDNHDVDRIASTLTDPGHLLPLHALLFTIPGLPSVYYGSEVGISGRKEEDDWPLRPALDPQTLGAGDQPFGKLSGFIRTLAGLRSHSPALTAGAYRQLYVSSEQLVFARTIADEIVVVAINGENNETIVPLPGEAAISDADTYTLMWQASWTYDGEGPAQTWRDREGTLTVRIPPLGAVIFSVRR